MFKKTCIHLQIYGYKMFKLKSSVCFLLFHCFCYVLTHHISAQCCFSYRNHSFNLHQLTCSANQMTGFYMNCNTGLIWVNTKTARKLNTGNDLFVFPLYRCCIDSLYCLSTLSGQLFVFYCIFSLLQASNFFPPQHHFHQEHASMALDRGQVIQEWTK